MCGWQLESEDKARRYFEQFTNHQFLCSSRKNPYLFEARRLIFFLFFIEVRWACLE